MEDERSAHKCASMSLFDACVSFINNSICQGGTYHLEVSECAGCIKEHMCSWKVRGRETERRDRLIRLPFLTSCLFSPLSFATFFLTPAILFLLLFPLFLALVSHFQQEIKFSTMYFYCVVLLIYSVLPVKVREDL